MKQDFCKDRKVMDQVIQKAQNDDFFRDIRDMVFRKENLILSLKNERDEARTDCAIAEKIISMKRSDQDRYFIRRQLMGASKKSMNFRSRSVPWAKMR